MAVSQEMLKISVLDISLKNTDLNLYLHLSAASELISLTHWGWVMHICVFNLAIIGSDNGLSPGRCQAIAWTNVGILLIGPLGTNFSEMLIEIHTFSFKKIHLKMSSGKWRPFCLGLNVLRSLHSIDESEQYGLYVCIPWTHCQDPLLIRLPNYWAFIMMDLFS